MRAWVSWMHKIGIWRRVIIEVICKSFSSVSPSTFQVEMQSLSEELHTWALALEANLNERGILGETYTGIGIEG